MLNRDECIMKISLLCRDYDDILGRVVLFGSVARGEQNEDSDIDLYIESANTTITTSKLEQNKRFQKFILALYDLYDGKVEYDILSYGGIRDIEKVKESVVYQQIETEGVVLYDKGTKTV